MSLGEYIGAGSGTTKLLLHLNGNSTDSSGNGNNGTDTNISYSQANGKFGQGAGFNASGLITTNLIFGGNDNQTRNIWFKLANTTQNGDLLYDFDNTTHVSFELKFNAGNLAFNRIKQGVVVQSTNGSFSDATSWHLATCTYDGSTIKLYVDGKRLGTDTAASGDGKTVSTSINHIGCNGYVGNLDEAIFENYAWTPQEVAKYYTMTKGRFGII